MPEVFISKQKKPRKPKNLKTYGLLVVLVAGTVSLVLVMKHPSKPSKTNTTPSSQASTSSAQSGSQDHIGTTPKVFTGEQFQALYENFAYPNTQELQRPIVITGNSTADARIESLALSRGYKLRPVAVTGLVKVENELLQPLAAEAWQKLVGSAKSDGLTLTITSGFRSPSDQRELFVSRLYAKNVSAAEVAAGKADTAVNSVLSTTAIPGYSKHHSGFTVDIGCGNEPNKSFEASVCFAWLNDNNYINAKKSGWIPSYPKEAKNQGPAPEAWEYVWVGTAPLFD